MIGELFRTWTDVAATGIEAAAVLVIIVAAVRIFVRAMGTVLRPTAVPAEADVMRLNLAKWLALAIEFELAADILRTAATPSWDDLGKLAAIVVIRTVINIFLQREAGPARLPSPSSDP